MFVCKHGHKSLPGKYIFVNSLRELFSTNSTYSCTLIWSIIESAVNCAWFVLIFLPYIERRRTNFREPISVETRVSLTLFYLTTGGFYKTPNTTFVVSIPMISKIVCETCHAIVDIWQSEVMMSHIQRTIVASYKRPLPEQVEFPTHLGCSRWEAHTHQETHQFGKSVLQLQEVLLNRFIRNGRCGSMIHIYESWCRGEILGRHYL